MSHYTESNVFFLGLLMNIVVGCFTVVQKLIYYNRWLFPVYLQIVDRVKWYFCFLVNVILQTIYHKYRSFFCLLCIFCILYKDFLECFYRNFFDPYYDFKLMDS